jgi:galactokinase
MYPPRGTASQPTGRAGGGKAAPALARALDALPKAEFVARAPGRANLIGEHTDYNEGFVLPVALELSTYVVGRRSNRLVLRSLDESGTAVIDTATGAGPLQGWGRYATAVVRALMEARYRPADFEGVIASDVPVGAGLSSSAALEVALATALVPELGGNDLAKICRRAENHFVGVQCGLMDQLSSVGGVEGHALLIDCRDYSVSPIPLPESLTVLLIDSAVGRGLATSAYNDRVAQCRRAAETLGVESLRDAALGDLARLEDPVLRRRARHVMSENARVLETAGALRAADAARLRHLFAESHRSYARDFEASTAEIDDLVAIAAGTEGIVGSRLTGGGFGGCTVNLVDPARAGKAAAAIVAEYGRRTGRRARTWLSEPGAGAALWEPPDPM